jgi:hypothetical protein
VRVRRDPREAEGWPEAPARYGNLHWRGREWKMGEARIYAYTDRTRLIARLLAIPGVHRWQIGDREAAVWMAADDSEAIRAVAGLLRVRVRRAPETGRSAEALAAARPRPDAATAPPGALDMSQGVARPAVRPTPGPAHSHLGPDAGPGLLIGSRP